MNIRRLLFFPLAVSLAACSILPKPSTHAVTRYELAPKIPNLARPKFMSSDVLRVNAVQAEEPYATDDLVYSEHPLALASFAYHQWVAPPASMFTHELVAALSKSKLYREVLGPTDPGHAQEILAVRITRGPVQIFHKSRQRAAPQVSKEQMVIKAVLTNADTGRVLASKFFSASESAKPNPYGGVAAANALAGDLLASLEKWLDKEHQNKKSEFQHSQH